MSIVIKRPKKYRPAQAGYDELLERNRQLRSAIDDNERRSIGSMVTISILFLRRWWHHTAIRLGLKNARTIDEFNLERQESPTKLSVWQGVLKRIEAQDKSREETDYWSAEPIHCGVGQSSEHAQALQTSKELNATCDSLYVQYREKIWQRRQADGTDAKVLDKQIEAIVDMYQSQRATHQRTVKELQAWEKGER
jgi:hypothetical protein